MERVGRHGEPLAVTVTADDEDDPHEVNERQPLQEEDRMQSDP